MVDGRSVQSAIAKLLREEHGEIKTLKETQADLVHATTHARVELYRELLAVLEKQARLQQTRLEKAEMRCQETPTAAEPLGELIELWQDNLNAIETIQDLLRQAITLLRQP
ncbi:hypothetical protein KAU37_12105 [Candidatus Bipolaricaulota bacterium]|nr:hypothetical protein [Candidatus Bipolaricaulota bacterium]